MKLNYKKLNKDAKTPYRGSAEAAGVDLYALLEEPVWIAPHSTYMIGTGIALEIPSGYFGAVFARSGLASKMGLRPANCTGIIDGDFRGEVKVALHNDSDDERQVVPNERIAQLVIIPYLPIEFNEVQELSETVRGEGGFSSTGLM